MFEMYFLHSYIVLDQLSLRGFSFHHFHFLGVFPAASRTRLFLFLWTHDGNDVSSSNPAAAAVVDVMVDVDGCDAVVVPVRAGEQLVGCEVWFGATEH